VVRGTSFLIDYQEFKKLAGQLVGINLNEYKSQQMDRRIHSLMQSWELDNYDLFLETLKTNTAKYKEFVKKLTINVSEFFRNPERFMELWHRVLPELLAEHATLKIWSAGCSNGAEPYSVALIVNELGVSDRIEIFGTDIDEVILNKARKGVYEFNDLKNTPPELVDKYFTLTDNQYHLNSNIKNKVNFLSHNLLKDPFLNSFHLIICRNVVIYFTEEAKRNLYLKFYDSLIPGGYLLVGGTEPLLAYRKLGFVSVSASFYQKPKSISDESDLN